MINNEQKAHDVGIAFAAAYMNRRLNDDSNYMDMETQYLNFITDYTFASSEFIKSNGIPIEK